MLWKQWLNTPEVDPTFNVICSRECLRLAFTSLNNFYNRVWEFQNKAIQPNIDNWRFVTASSVAEEHLWGTQATMIEVCRQPALCELYTAVAWRWRVTKSTIYYNNVSDWITLANHITLTSLPFAGWWQSRDNKIINKSAIIHGRSKCLSL